MKRIIFVNFHYSIEISPSIKNSIIKFSEKGYEVDVFIDDLYRDKSFVLEKGNLHILGRETRHKRNLKNIYTKYFIKILRQNPISWLGRISAIGNFIVQYTFPGLNDFQTKLNRYDLKADWYFVSDLLSLFALYPLLDNQLRKKIIFWSFELEAYFLPYKMAKNTISNMLNQCALILIQDEERAKEFSKLLGLHPKYIYIPVSLLGKPREKKGEMLQNLLGLTKDDFIVLYSGYIADWSMLDEIIESFDNWPSSCHLVIHGHTMGTESFKKKLEIITQKNPRIHFLDNYVPDKNYEEFVSSADAGISFYKPIGPNFSNVLNSSGKIATYLKCGLPILTNVKQSNDRYLESIISGLETSEIGSYLQIIMTKKQFYSNKAKLDFLQYYSFENYFQNILDFIYNKEYVVNCQRR